MPKAEIPSIYEGKPVLTAEQARKLDERATAKHGIPAADLMERAGKGVALLAGDFLREQGGAVDKAKVVVACGRGANGGDGLVAARYLVGLGASVKAFVCPEKKDTQYPRLLADNLAHAKAVGVVVEQPNEAMAAEMASADLLIDALLGTGSAGKPAGPVLDMIQAITRAKKPVIAVDIPSGIHPDTGHHSGAFVTAAVTVTFGWAKRGLLASHAQKNVGRLVVLDIGYPAELKP